MKKDKGLDQLLTIMINDYNQTRERKKKEDEKLFGDGDLFSEQLKVLNKYLKIISRMMEEKEPYYVGTHEHKNYGGGF